MAIRDDDFISGCSIRMTAGTQRLRCSNLVDLVGSPLFDAASFVDL